MGPLLLALLLTAPSGADTLPTYADAETRAVVARAMARQAAQDTLVTDYSASLHYRLTISFGERRWARVPAFGVEEQDARVEWARPNDLQVRVVGARSRSRWPDVDLTSEFSRPWFVPRALGDSVRLLGKDFPERAALHPFAPDGPLWYHYALVDSTRIRDPRGRTITLLGVQVVPRRTGLALVAGEIWVDAGTWDVVRFSFRFVGTGLWSVPDGKTARDSADAESDNRTINRILTVDADLEYALEDGKYWMPYRQSLSGTLTVPFLGGLVIPFSATTTFTDYSINRGLRLAFSVPIQDSARAGMSGDSTESAGRHERAPEDSNAPRAYAGRLAGGGRYEVHVASKDSLRAYRGWVDSLVLDAPGDDRADLRQLQASLADLSETLPREMTGAPGSGFTIARLADAVRYDRVQGLALGWGWHTPVPGVAFTSAYVTAHYGLSDQRVTGRLDLTREAPSGRWTASGFREVSPVDAVFAPKLLANSANALFAGHDNADWMLATGGAVRYETSVAFGVDLSLEGGLEEERSVVTRAHSAVNDFLGGTGDFQPNPVVAEGTFGTARIAFRGKVGAAYWLAGADFRGGAPGATARLFGEWGSPLWGAAWAPALTLRGGVTTDRPLPQSAFRIGGPWSARAYQYGIAGGPAFWSLQLDQPLGAGAVRPVIFADAAQAGRASGLLLGPVYADAGIGVSILGGLVRFDLSQPLHPAGGGVRFDLVFGGAR